MKIYTSFFIICALVIISCKTPNTLNNSNTKDTEIAETVNDTVKIANEELEYEVIIIDPGFNGWLAARARPRGYHSQPFLEVKNQQWVTEWNSRVNNPQRYGELYQMRIDYRSQIDYGYEVNYLLYNYLLYFQLKNNQRFGGIVPQY